MSGSKPQFTPRDVLRSVLVSPSKLVILAAVSMLLFILLPTLIVSTTVIGVGTERTSVSGTGVAGLIAWLCLVTFIAAASSRFMAAALPYGKLLDLSAFGMIGVTLIWSAFGGPLATGLRQLNALKNTVTGLLGPSMNMFQGASGNTQPLASISIYPHLGVVLFILAPVALVLARRREGSLTF